MIMNYYYCWGGGEAGNKVKKYREKKKKKALRGEKFIYYNNLHRIMYKNLIRKIKPRKIKINLIIKGNNNR